MSKIIYIILIAVLSFGNLNAFSKLSKKEKTEERRSKKLFNKRMSMLIQTGLNSVEGHSLLTTSVGVEALKYFSNESNFSYGGRGYLTFVGTDNDTYTLNNSLGIFLNLDGKLNYNITHNIDMYYILGVLYGRDYNIESKFGLNNAIGFGYELSDKFYLSTEYSYKTYFGDVIFTNDSSYLLNINMKY